MVEFVGSSGLIPGAYKICEKKKLIIFVIMHCKKYTEYHCLRYTEALKADQNNAVERSA